MTVATEASYAERVYTGVETDFPAGFSAEKIEHVFVSYLDAVGLPIALTQGVHFSVSLDSELAVTVTRIAFPSASVTVPVTIAIERITPATQGVDFTNLAVYDASVHERIADAGAMRDAECRNNQMRHVTPFNASLTTVDFRPRQVRAADPLDPSDLATKAYADLVSGTSAAGASAASAAAALASQIAAAGSATSALGSANLAAASALILANPDYGFYTDIPTTSRDYGTYV